jgi:twitching motility two-component system response regulator PilH
VDPYFGRVMTHSSTADDYGSVPPAPSRGGRGLHILVVEDSPQLGDILVGALEHEGCAASLARTSSQALQLARRLEPDLITLDLGQPGRVDADTVRTLRADPLTREIPLIVIASPARGLPLADPHIARVFSKPFYVAEVVDAVLTVLGRA